jgi:hypothetical protein
MFRSWLVAVAGLVTFSLRAADLKVTEGERTFALSGARVNQYDRPPCKAGLKFQYHGGTICIPIALIKEIRAIDKKDKSAEVVLSKGTLDPTRLRIDIYSIVGQSDFGALTIPLEGVDRIEVTKVDNYENDALVDPLPVDADRPYVKISLRDGASLLMRIESGLYQRAYGIQAHELGGTLEIKYSSIRSVSCENSATGDAETVSCRITLKDGKSRIFEVTSHNDEHGRIEGVGSFFVKMDQVKSMEFQ